MMSFKKVENHIKIKHKKKNNKTNNNIKKK